MSRQPEAERLLTLAQDVVEQAKKKGADDVEAWAERERQTAVTIEQSDLKGVQVDEHGAVGVRVLVGDKAGFAYVNRLDASSISEALDDALAFARASPGDEANALVTPAEAGEVAGLWDEAVVGLAPDEAVRRASEMLEAARAVDKRVSVDTGELSAGVSHVAIASSRGAAAAASDAGVAYGLFGMAVDGDEVGSFDHIFEARRALADVSHAELGARFGERVLGLLAPVDGRSFKGRVLFSTEAFEEIFVDTLLAAVDGDEVHKGRSRLREKLGERVARDSFTLVDDGTIAGAIGSAPFDREGVPHRRTPIVDGGVLKTFLYDGRSARRAGAASTGHAAGSARSQPSIGTTNVAVLPGELDDAALLREAGDALLVGRFSGSTDAVSGDFSGVAKGSFLVAGGERGRPVKETMVAGNVFELLERVVALGSRVHESYAFSSPWVLVDGVDVTAG